MRPWAHQLSLAALTRCAGSSSSGGKFLPRGGPQPLLADRLGAEASTSDPSEVLPKDKREDLVRKGGADALRPRERRLVAAALSPATVLPQAPSAGRNTALPVDTGDLRPRGLPSEALQALRRPDAPPEGTGKSKTSPGAAPQRRGNKPLKPVAIPAKMQRIICSVLYADFVAVTPLDEKRGQAIQLCRGGEAQEGGSKFRIVLGAGGVQAIVGLFLDGELSWERAREHLQHEAMDTQSD